MGWGVLGTLLAAAVTIWWVARALSRVVPRALLAGQTAQESQPGVAKKSWWLPVVALSALLAGAGLLVSGFYVHGQEAQAGSFFGAGMLFLTAGKSTKAPGELGQRGRQRAILREGVYAINLALFIVITEDNVYQLDVQGQREIEKLFDWQKELAEIEGFDPVVVGGLLESVDPLKPDHTLLVDSIGIVTVQDGPSLSPGEIIAPSVGNDSTDPNYHNNSAHLGDSQ